MPAKEYAKAFYDLASKDDLHNFYTFVDCLEDDFISIMESKRVLTYDKVQIIDQVVGKFELLSNFLNVLVENNRFGLCRDIKAALKGMENKKNNVVNIDIIVNKEISDKALNEIKSKLKKSINKDIDTNVIVDKDIIGGIKIKYDGKILDNSLLSVINDLKKELSK